MNPSGSRRFKKSGCCSVVLVSALMASPWIVLARPLHLVPLRGVIDPISANFVKVSFRDAMSEGAGAILLDLNTPGGLKDPSDVIIQEIRASTVPVIARIGDQGQAISTGVNIALAADAVVMAPGARIGNAKPLEMGDRLITEAAAELCVLAESKGKNPSWVERIVEGEMFDAPQALNQGMIDLVAEDNDAIVKALNGKTILRGNRVVTLSLDNRTYPHVKHWFGDVLHALAKPNAAYALLLLGFYGLLFHLLGKGAGLLAPVGGLSLMLAITSLQALPFNGNGILLILAGIGVLFLATGFMRRGLMTTLGLILFAAGSFQLFKSPISYFTVSPLAIVGGVLVSASLFTLLAEQRTPKTQRPKGRDKA